MPSPNDAVRQSFTTQATAFAATPWVKDERRIQRLVAATRTPLERAAEVRRLVEEDMGQDRSGARPFQDATGKLFFHARTAILAGRRFSS